MEIGAGITVAIFLLGLAYQLGRHSVRIEALEKDRDEQRGQHQQNQTALGNIREELARLSGREGLPFER